MFKLKSKSKIKPQVGTYFYYREKNENNLFKIVLTDINLGRTYFAWWSERNQKCLVTSGTEITIFTDAVIDKKYVPLLEEDYYMIPDGLKNFIWGE